jgi:hypothetical protein
VAFVGSHLDIADPRQRGGYLRLSWHAAGRVIVVSQWRDGVCVATTPVGVQHLGALVGFLIGALQEAATDGWEVRESTKPSTGQRIVTLFRRWLRLRSAPVIAIANRRVGYQRANKTSA